MSNWYENLDDAVDVGPAEAPQSSRGIGDYIKDVGRAIGQGVTFGTADEIEGFVRSLRSGVSYDDAVKKVRQEIEQFRTDEPGLAYTSEIGASALMPLGLAGLAGKGLAKGAQLINKPLTDLVGTTASKVGQKVGEALPQALTTPTAKVAGTAGVLGAAYGAGSAEEGQRVSGALMGGGVGSVLGPLAPRVSESAAKLIPQGVKTTVGQTFEGGFGSLARGVEDVMARIPVMGVSPQAMQQRALRSFNVAAVNKALEPLGVKPLSTSMQPRKAVSQAYEILGKQYDDVLDTVSLPATPSFMSGLSNVVDGSDVITREAKDILKGKVKEVINRYSVNGSLDKQAFKKAQMDLRGLADEYKGSQKSVAEQDMGKVIDKVSDEFFEQLAKINPDAAPAIKKIDSAYSRFKPLQYLTAMSNEKSGTYTANQLLREIKAGGRRQSGLQQLVDVDRPLQDLAMTAQDVLPQRIVGSDTAMKELALGATGLGAGSQVTPDIATILATAVAAPMAVYNPVTQRLMGRGVDIPRLGRASGMSAAGAGVRSPAAAGLLSQQVPSPISSAQAGSIENMAAGGNIVGYETVTDRQGNPVTFAKTSDGRAVRVR
jgi:hypothetical protein